MKTPKTLIPLLLLFSLLCTAIPATAQSGEASTGQTAAADELSLLTDTPEEGFQLAITLARKGVTSTQPNRDVLFMLRDVYANDPDALIASSQVIAIHFQTVAAANNYWRDAQPGQN